MAGRMLRDVIGPHGAFVGPQSNAFCKHTDQEPIECSCGEEEKEFAWVWSTREQGGQAGSILLSSEDRQIIFNPEYSSGTAAIRGSEPLFSGFHHYWELKMTSAVYGTDIMVGVCTPKCDLQYGIHRFCSLLGRDKESWGYSYTGTVQHAAKFRHYGPRWGKGSIVGIHLDSWRGTLEFFLNRKPLGIAFTGLQNKQLYPIVTSTSAHSGMKLVTSCSFPANLQFLSSEVVFKHLCEKMKMHPQDLPLPPGLRSFVENNYWPLLRSVGQGHGPKNNDNIEQKYSFSGMKHAHEDDPKEGTIPKRFCGQALQCRSRSASTSDTYSDRSSPSSNYCFTGSDIRFSPSPSYVFTGSDVSSPSSPNHCFTEFYELNFSLEPQSNPSPAFTTLSSNESTSLASPSTQHPAPGTRSSFTLQPKTSGTSSKPSSSQEC